MHRHKRIKIVENGKTLLAAAIECINDGNWKQAILLLRRGVDMYKHHGCHNKLSNMFTRYDIDEIETFIDEADAGDISSQFFVGFINRKSP